MSDDLEPDAEREYEDVLTMWSAEGASFTPYTVTERGDDDAVIRLEVGIRVLLPNGDEHTVTLVPASDLNGSDPASAVVFIYEDDRPITHFAWKE